MAARLLLPIALASCKPAAEPDGDQDGSPRSEDCDDSDPRVAPGRDEECDGLDNNCDERIDEGLLLGLHTDADGDSYGASETTLACAAGDGIVADGSDCDDGDSNVHPGADEVCANAIDEDCDGLDADESDHDGDGGYSDACPGGTDCNDADADVHVGAEETCGDGIDDDCDGADLPCGSPFEGNYDLEDAPAIVTGAGTADAGRVLQSGDVTGDGIDDVFTGTLHAHDDNGGGWVVPGPVNGTVELRDVGFDLAATEVTGGAGRSIGLGDVNGDGIDDVAFGAPYTDTNGQYVVHGPITDDVDLEKDHDAAIVWSVPGTLFAHGSDLGDVDGDGIADSAIAACSDSSGGNGSGTLWVTYGPLTGNLDPDVDADAMIAGEHEGASAGRAVHVEADIDGDGLDDIVLNAIIDATGGPSAGAVYVVYGPADITSLADAAMLVGPHPYAVAGQEFTSGDYDADGYGDVAAYVWTSPRGNVYVTRGPLAADSNLADADVILEAEDDLHNLGAGLGSGDFEGDGTDDLLAGAPAAESGISYLVVEPPTGTSTISDVAVATFRGADWGPYAGQSFAIGNLDGEGAEDLVVGAPGLLSSGGVYVEYAPF